MYAQTLMLALTAPPPARRAHLAFFPTSCANIWGWPPNYKLLFGLSFGYEDPSVKANGARVGRAPIDDAVTFDR